MSAGQTKYELLGLIAAGEYPLHFLYDTASKPVVSFCLSYVVSMWEVLDRFDSEAAMWVSGAAETVYYFG